MTHWTAGVLDSLSRSLADAGVDVTEQPSAPPARFEAIALAGLVARCLERGFTTDRDVLELSRTNHLPYRRVTQGSGINQRPELDQLVQWASPLVSIERDGRTLSFFREGTPFHRSRDRPDLLVYDAAFTVETRSDPFTGEHVLVSWDGETAGRRRYKRETDANGPVVAQREGTPVEPSVGLEVSLNKSCDRLADQVDLLRTIGCRHVAALLDHENPCPSGRLPAETRVFKADDEASLHRSMDDLARWITEGRTDE